jgi:hypothetical protein
MRYVIVDPEGSSRAYFGSLYEVRKWARTLKTNDPDLLHELQLLTYDADGNTVANQWLSDFVPEMPAIISTLVGLREGSLIGTAWPQSSPTLVSASAGEDLSEASSGTAGSMTPGSVHLHTRASDTLAPGAMEMAVG